jgi:hypothetical protein
MEESGFIHQKNYESYGSGHCKGGNALYELTTTTMSLSSQLEEEKKMKAEKRPKLSVYG